MSGYTKGSPILWEKVKFVGECVCKGGYPIVEMAFEN